MCDMEDKWHSRDEAGGSLRTSLWGDERCDFREETNSWNQDVCEYGSSYKFTDSPSIPTGHTFSSQIRVGKLGGLRNRRKQKPAPMHEIAAAYTHVFIALPILSCNFHHNWVFFYSSYIIPPISAQLSCCHNSSICLLWSSPLNNLATDSISLIIATFPKCKT